MLAALMNEQKHSVVGKMKPLTNFREWKFRDTPNYAALPIDENPEYNVPMAVKDAVFSKVRICLCVLCIICCLGQKVSYRLKITFLINQFFYIGTNRASSR